MSHAPVLRHAIDAAKAGNPDLAKIHLQNAAAEAPEDAAVWLWMGWLANSPLSMKQCLEIAQRDSRFSQIAAVGVAFADALSQFDLDNINELAVADLERAENAREHAQSELATDAAVEDVATEDSAVEPEEQQIHPHPPQRAVETASDEKTPEAVCSPEPIRRTQKNQGSPAFGPKTSSIADEYLTHVANVNAAAPVIEEAATQIDPGETENQRAESEETKLHSTDTSADRVQTATPSDGADRVNLWRAAQTDWFSLDNTAGDAETPAAACDPTVLINQVRETILTDEVDSERPDDRFEELAPPPRNSTTLDSDVVDSTATVVPLEPGKLTEPVKEGVGLVVPKVPSICATPGDGESVFDQPIESIVEEARSEQLASEADLTSDAATQTTEESRVVDAVTSESRFASTLSSHRGADSPASELATSAGLQGAEPLSATADQPIAAAPLSTPDAEPLDSGFDAESEFDAMASEAYESGNFENSNDVVLVVDDSPTVRKLIAMTLEKRGIQVASAFDGVAAIKEIAAKNPSLILMDVNMPRLDGYQLCKLVKKHNTTKHIPVILLTGKDGMFDRLRGRLVGCSGYISKPFVPDELVATVEQFLAVPK